MLLFFCAATVVDAFFVLAPIAQFFPLWCWKKRLFSWLHTMMKMKKFCFSTILTVFRERSTVNSILWRYAYEFVIVCTVVWARKWFVIINLLFDGNDGSGSGNFQCGICVLLQQQKKSFFEISSNWSKKFTSISTHYSRMFITM